MKDKFFGYYRPTNEDFEAIWKNGIISIDANVMLNLYTYSPETATEITDLFKKVHDRLWVPHRVAEEYHRNRIKTILKESKRYSEIEKQFNGISSAFESGKAHPFISADLVKKYERLRDEIKSALTKGAKKHRGLIEDDPICQKLSEIFTGRVGDPMEPSSLKELFETGKERYENKIPPGYQDAKKPEPDRYGDLIIWMQLIQESSQQNKPVIFVTDDAKEDWWIIAEGRRVGPRPELRHEFRAKTGSDIYIYSTDQFLETAKTSGETISDKAVGEIEGISQQRAHDMIERLAQDSLERMRKQKHHEMIERLTLEQWRREQRIIEGLTLFPGAIDESGEVSSDTSEEATDSDDTSSGDADDQ